MILRFAWSLRRGRIRRLAALIPYIAVLAGLHYLRSAWAAMLFYQAGMAVVLLRQPFDWSVLWRGWRWRDVLLLSALTGASGIVLFLCKDVWLTELGSLERLLDHVGLARNHFPLFILSFSIVTPVLEEAFWRGLLGSTSIRLALSDLLFAGYHILVLVKFTSILCSV